MPKSAAFIIPTDPSTGNILVAQKFSGMWNFFGGSEKRRDKKHPLITALREFHEETGIAVMNADYETNFLSNNKQLVFVFATDLRETAVIQLSKEHQAYKWVRPREIKNLKLTKRSKDIYLNTIHKELNR